MLRWFTAPGRLAGWLALLALAFALAAVAADFAGFTPGMDIDAFNYQIATLGKTNILPTAYNAILLSGCAILSLWIARGRRLTLYWIGLGVIFVLLALEKLTSGNETFFVAFRAWISQIDYFRENWYWYTTALFAGLFGVALAGAYLPFLLRLDRRTRRGLIAGGILLVIGSFGVELAGSAFIQVEHGAALGQQTALLLSALDGMELLIETLSSVVFFHTLADLFRRRP